jgi:ribosome recycling factor
MDFRPLNEMERKQLVNALRGNAEQGRVLLLDRRDTSFAGSAEEVPDEEVISAIKSVPCHY